MEMSGGGASTGTLPQLAGRAPGPASAVFVAVGGGAVADGLVAEGGKAVGMMGGGDSAAGEGVVAATAEGLETACVGDSDGDGETAAASSTLCFAPQAVSSRQPDRTVTAALVTMRGSMHYPWPCEG